MSTILDVTGFGADPTGKQPSTEAFRLAFQRVTESGIIKVPTGAFLLDDTVTLDGKHGVTILLHGVVKVRPHDASQTTSLFTIKKSRLCRFVGEGGRIESADGNPDLFKIGAFLEFDDECWGASVSNLHLLNAFRDHIRFMGPDGCSVRGCLIQGGFPWVEDPSGEYLSRYGVYFKGVEGLTIADNHFLPSITGTGKGLVQAIGSSTDYSDGVTITGNRIVDTFDHGLYCHALQGSIVTGNTFSGTRGSAIRVRGQRNIINGNTIHNTTGGGIELTDCAHGVVSNNIITALQKGHGIQIGPFANNVVEDPYKAGDFTEVTVSGNLIRGKGPLVQSGIALTTVLRVGSEKKPRIVATHIRTKVIGNTIVRCATLTGNGYASLDVQGLEPGLYHESLDISGNTISEGGPPDPGENAKSVGIRLQSTRNSICMGNIVLSGEPANRIVGDPINSIVDRNIK